jgi:hypothetical protein
MAPPSPPGKRRRITLLEAIIVIGGFLAIIGYNRISIRRLQQSLPNVNSKIIGEWKSERGPEHLLFRTDDSVSMTVPAEGANNAGATADASGPPPVTGKYKLYQTGKIYIQLMNGKKYHTTISPINPNRFDLIDAETDGVTTFDRVSARPASEGKAVSVPPASAEAPAAAKGPSTAEVPAVPEAPSTGEPSAAPEAPSAAEAPPASDSAPAGEAPAATK